MAILGDGREMQAYADTLCRCKYPFAYDATMHVDPRCEAYEMGQYRRGKRRENQVLGN